VPEARGGFAGRIFGSGSPPDLRPAGEPLLEILPANPPRASGTLPAR